MRSNISEHITYEEATYSSTAELKHIDNTPGDKELINMQYLAAVIFEPTRNHFNVPIRINSFFRSWLLNKFLKGSSVSSQHPLGLAIDISAISGHGISNRMIFDWIFKNLEFDQLIWEFGNDSNPQWIHISVTPNNNRKEVLRSIKTLAGRTKYAVITKTYKPGN